MCVCPCRIADLITRRHERSIALVFASLFFLYIFMPLCLISYFFAKSMPVKNAILIAFSLFFYAWGAKWFVFVMILTAFLDWCHGLIISGNRGTPLAKVSLIISLVTDIGMLVCFKYLAFLTENLNFILPIDIPVPNIVLPIGISFYTFQTLTYVIDVYRGKAKPQQSFFRYLLYLSSYFQLVAGPIVRYEDVDGYLENRVCTPDGVARGFTRFATGLIKKVVIADIAFEFVTKYMDGNLSAIPTLGAWFGMIMFTIQIYFDFSGYSDMAIGLASMFGFKFPENFNYPYVSKSVSEFWRRWHISLGSFFRDYVYIPLGGNRRHLYRNLFIVWLLTGVWHGASWNFVLWGLYNGLFIILERRHPDFFKRMGGFTSHLYLLTVVNFGFMLFHFTDMSKVGAFLLALIGVGTSGFASTELWLDILNNIWWLVVAIIGCMPVMKYIDNFGLNLEYGSKFGAVTSNVVRTAYVLFAYFICTAFLVGNSLHAFLYFQF